MSIPDDLPWVEKYRPTTLGSLVLSEQILIRVNKMIEQKELQNIILEGPPGVGKTSTIKCIATKLYGPYVRDMVLELNAADDRGIKIYDAIENFMRSYIHIKDEDKHKYAEHKLVILDEVDNMTNKAKYIVSKFIENKASRVRFALTCNIKSNILPSIQSKCVSISYPKLSPEFIYKKLVAISRRENIFSKSSNENNLHGMRTISMISDGDLRTAINMLQLTYNRFKEISEQHVYEIYDKPRPAYAIEIIRECCNDDVCGAMKKIMDMKQSGYSGMDIMLGLIVALKMPNCNEISEKNKISLMKVVSHTLYNISKGIDTQLQLVACCADMCESCK